MPHIASANRSQVTTGKVTIRTGTRVEDRQDHPPAGLGTGRPQEQRDRRAERQQRRRDQRQQDVLDHVDAEQGRVVALDRRLEGDDDRARARAASRPSGSSGRGSPDGRDRPSGPPTGRRPPARTIGTTTVGSNDQAARTSAGPAPAPSTPWARAIGARLSQARPRPTGTASPSRARVGPSGVGSPAHSAPDRARRPGPGPVRAQVPPGEPGPARRDRARYHGRRPVRHRRRVARTPPHVVAQAHPVAPRGDRCVGRDGDPAGRLRLVRTAAPVTTRKPTRSSGCTTSS